MIFYKSFWWYFEAYNKFKKYGEKKFKLNIVKVMKFNPKLGLAICFWTVLLMISSHLGILYLSTWHKNRGHYEKYLISKTSFVLL